MYIYDNIINYALFLSLVRKKKMPKRKDPGCARLE